MKKIFIILILFGLLIGGYYLRHYLANKACTEEMNKRDKKITELANQKVAGDESLNKLEKENIQKYVACLNANGIKSWIVKE